MRCDKCLYGKYPKKIIEASNQASLVIIAEAPTAMDLHKDTYMNGPAGNLLRSTMEKVGMNTEDVVYLTALGCLPPKGKPIKKEAIKLCRERLMAEILKVQPKVILALGGTALQAVTGDGTLKITQEQGTIRSCPEFPEAKVIPITSPSAILRSPGAYKIFHQIMLYASQVLNGEGVRDPGKIEYKLISTPSDMNEALKILSASKIVAADIEAKNLDRTSSNTSDILNLGVAYHPNKTLVFTPSVFQLLPRIFELPMEWIWHYGYGYDAMYCRSRGLNVPLHHDTMLLHYCLNENSGTHNLEALSVQYLGAQSYKSEANKYITSEAGFASAPIEVQARRVSVDAAYTLQLYHKFMEIVGSSPELTSLYNNLLMPAAHLLIKIMTKGVLIDVTQMEVMRIHYEELLRVQLEQIQEFVKEAWDPELYKIQTEAKSAPSRFNPASPKQLAWLLFDRFKMKPPRKKKRSTDMEVLLSFGKDSDPAIAHHNLRTSHPWLAALLDMRSTRKELSTYVEGMIDRMDSNNRVHSSFTLHVTSTGRLSSTNPNMQNIPSIKKDIRRGIIVPAGHILMECDYKGAELRVLAHISGIGQLGQALIEGRDLHDELSIKFWGKGFTKAQRMQAKTVNFGVAYGRTAASIAIDFGITHKEAQDLIDTWFEMNPEAKQYLDSCVDDVLAGRPLWTPFGRCRRFGLITPDTVESIKNEAKNFRIQSISSDLTLCSAIKIQPLIEPYGAHIINLVHDSIVVECPEDKDSIVAVTDIIRHQMMQTPIDTLNSVVPFDIDIELGKNWADIISLDKYLEQNFK